MRLGPFFIGASHLGDYMRRWVLRTPWFTVRLHRILRADADEALHDHPWDFISFIFRGGYVEEVPFGPRPGGLVFRRREVPYYRGMINAKKATDLHRISHVQPGTLTLVVTGPEKRKWGFMSKYGWVYWREYNDCWKESSGEG